MHPPALRARLLGPVGLQLDDRPLPPLDSARAESLLAYLLLHRDAPARRRAGPRSPGLTIRPALPALRRPRGAGQLLLGEQAVLDGEHRGGGPAGGVDLGVDVLDVIAGRLGRDHQSFGYLLVG